MVLDLFVPWMKDSRHAIHGLIDSRNDTPGTTIYELVYSSLQAQ